MNKLFFFSLAITVLLFTACGPDEPSNQVTYDKLSYVNHDAVVDGVSDPMVNIEWLRNLQVHYDYDSTKYMYRALLQFTPKGDSVKAILAYSDFCYYYGDENYHYSQDVTLACIYNLDGTSYFEAMVGDDGESFNGMLAMVSDSTAKKITVLIDSILLSVNNASDMPVNNFMTRDLAPPPPSYQACVDTILNGVTDIEVLSCYKLIERKQ